MRTLLKIIMATVMMAAGTENALAQLGDPVLAGTWSYITKTETAAVAGATAATAATVPTINWYKSETRDYVNLRKKYYQYLDSIQGTLILYVNAIGLGMEINDLIKACNMAGKELKDNPDNFFATALTQNKRQIIFDVVKLAGDLCNMIGVAKTKAKVKETDRYKMIQDMRLKMRELTTKIRTLAYHIHYTNFRQLWFSLVNE